MSDETDNQRKRRVPRREIRARIGLLVHGRYSLSWAHEVGEGGMLISSPEKLNQGDQVVITLRIPEILHGVMLGRVAYVLPGEAVDTKYGIQFEKLDFEVKRKIRHYVASSNAQKRLSAKG